MYRTKVTHKTTIKRNTSYKGERLEQKIKRITTNKEPIKDNAPLVYTERKQGVQPDYDIRTDRFEVAVEAMDKITRSTLAKRDAKMGDEAKKNMDIEKKTETSSEGGEGKA